MTWIKRALQQVGEEEERVALDTTERLRIKTEAWKVDVANVEMLEQHYAEQLSPWLDQITLLNDDLGAAGYEVLKPESPYSVPAYDVADGRDPLASPLQCNFFVDSGYDGADLHSNAFGYKFNYGQFSIMLCPILTKPLDLERSVLSGKARFVLKNAPNEYTENMDVLRSCEGRIYFPGGAPKVKYVCSVGVLGSYKAKELADYRGNLGVFRADLETILGTLVQCQARGTTINTHLEQLLKKMRW